MARAYSSLDDIRNRTTQAIGPSTTPSQDTVEQWNNTGAAWINSALHRFDFDQDDPDIKLILEPINTNYVAARIFASLRQFDRANEFENLWRNDLKEILDGKISLGIPQRATFKNGQNLREKNYDDDGEVLGIPDE